MNWVIGETDLSVMYQDAFCEHLAKYSWARGSIDFINMYGGMSFQ